MFYPLNANNTIRPQLLFVSLLVLVLLSGCRGGSAQDETTGVAGANETLSDENGKATLTSAAELATSTAPETGNRPPISGTLEVERPQATAESEAHPTAEATLFLEQTEATATTEVGLGGTAIYEATAELPASLGSQRLLFLDELLSGPIFAGPLSGELAHQDDGSLAKYPASVEAANFVARASFVQGSRAHDPSATLLEQSDFGFLFHEKGQDFLALAVHTTGSWQLLKGSAEGAQVIQSGSIDPLETKAWHSLTLYVNGNDGLFLLDQAYVIDIILPGVSTVGAISVATGFSADSHAAGASTAFKDFTIWPIDRRTARATPTKEIFIAP